MKSIACVLGLSVMAAVAIGCAASSEDAGSGSADLSAGTPSKTLSADLFRDADPREPVDYVLFGKVPASSQACMVTLRRRGLNPPRNSWSTVVIAPLTTSQKTVDEVNVPFATPPDVSHDKESIQTSGDTVVYSRVDPTDATLKDDLTLTFGGEKSGEKSFETLASVVIAGKTVAGPHAASCAGLVPAIVLRPSEYTPTAKAAEKAWEKDNDENLDKLGVELESCDVSSATEVLCAFGNDTNEETLDISFALAKGKIGKVLHAERHSDFE